MRLSRRIWSLERGTNARTRAYRFVFETTGKRAEADQKVRELIARGVPVKRFRFVTMLFASSQVEGESVVARFREEHPEAHYTLTIRERQVDCSSS